MSTVAILSHSNILCLLDGHYSIRQNKSHDMNNWHHSEVTYLTHVQENFKYHFYDAQGSIASVSLSNQLDQYIISFGCGQCFCTASRSTRHQLCKTKYPSWLYLNGTNPVAIYNFLSYMTNPTPSLGVCWGLLWSLVAICSQLSGSGIFSGKYLWAVNFGVTVPSFA